MNFYELFGPGNMNFYELFRPGNMNFYELFGPVFTVNTNKNPKKYELL